MMTVEERNKVIQECIEKVESLITDNCDDHTPYYGPCVTCGQSDNPDVLPDPDIVLEKLEELKTK